MNKEEFNTLRADLGMTQKEVAEKTGYSIRAVQNWALGRTMSSAAEVAIKQLVVRNGIKLSKKVKK